MSGVENPVTPFEVKRASDLHETPPEARWLVESLWSDGGVGVIGGTPKSCKSWLGLELATAIATGTPDVGGNQVVVGVVGELFDDRADDGFRHNKGLEAFD